ncbi:hypothetical protein CPB97_010394 [Podila verticillata]|nr:hypothetical protein CPB97_010394 [Podila verticillata]
MTSYLWTLRCLVNGDPNSKSFLLTPKPTEAVVEPKTVEELGTIIHSKKSVWFNDVEVKDLTLWHVSIPDEDDEDQPIHLNNLPSENKEKL